MRFALILLLTLTACHSPGPHFRGLPATRISIADATFDVRVRDNLAEALRVNPQYAPRFGPVQGWAGLAMAQVSGCRVTEVRGDAALATGLLDCGDGPPREPDYAGLKEPLECIPVRGSAQHGVGQIRYQLECY